MIKLEKLLAENMRRFNTKNLAEQAPGAAKTTTPPVAGQKGTSAGVPPSLTLNYDNGMLRFNEFFGKDGNLIWDINITFTGGPNGLTATGVVLNPGDSSSVKPGTKALTIPLMKTFTVPAPLDFKADDRNNKMFQAGMQLNTKSPGAIATGLDEMKLMNVSANLGFSSYTALSNLAADKGWYTGPKQVVAKQYALFTNHDGSKDMF
jgi:hypothetical protein